MKKFVALAFLSAACLLPQTTQAQAEPAQDEAIAVTLNSMTLGLEDREPGSPVVIFESGFATPLENWQPVFAEVSKIAPVIAYDRAGIGKSPAAQQPPTIELSIERLEALLSSLHVEPPYILVGHSWGGLLAYKYSLKNPDDVEGLVLIDPTDPSMTEEEDRQLFVQAGAGDDGVDRFYSVLMSAFTQAPPGIAAELQVIDRFRRTNQGIPEGSEPLEMPIAILLGGRLSIPPQMADATGIDIEKYGELATRRRLAGFQEIAMDSPNGLVALSTHSGHFVHQDDPELVVESIRRMVAAAGRETGNLEGSAN